MRKRFFVFCVGVTLSLVTLGRQAQTQPETIPVTAPEVAQIMNLKGINTPYSEYTPFITTDEKFLFFQSNRPGGVAESGDYDLWYTENEVTDGVPQFKTPADVGFPVNSTFFDGHPTLRKLPNGEYEMYFTSFAEEGRSGPQLTNLYYTISNTGKWSAPIPVIEINTDFHERTPSISQDGRFLFFSSDRPGGFGKDDIWVSEYDFAAKRWGKPRNLGSTINTPASEVTPAIHSDSITLYFSSDRKGGVGGYDIYVTQDLDKIPGSGKTEQLWKKPQNLGIPFNSTFDDEYPTVIRNGNFMYFASNREGGQGSFDIYRARVPEFAKPEVVITLKGHVKEKSSDKGIEANIRLTDVEDERNFSTGMPDGLYGIDLINHKQYKLTVSAPGYTTIEYLLDLRDIHEPTTLTKDFEMERSLLFPKDFSVTVLFVNEKGVKIDPTATYRMVPDILDDKILSTKNGSAQLTIPGLSQYAKPEDAITALENISITISAQKKGFEDTSETKKFKELIDFTIAPVTDRTEWKITMKTAGSEIDVVMTPSSKGGRQAIVYFSTNVSDHMNNEKAVDLKKIATLWKKDTTQIVTVHGHTDSRGDKGYNMRLSKARAEFIKKRLAEFGISSKMIRVKAFGATRPASKNEKTFQGRAKNRRVEIYFSASGNSTADAAAESEKPSSFEKKRTSKPIRQKMKISSPEPVEPSNQPTPAEPESVSPTEPQGQEPVEAPTPVKPESGADPSAPESAAPKASPDQPAEPTAPNTEPKANP